MENVRFHFKSAFAADSIDLRAYEVKFDIGCSYMLVNKVLHH